MGGGQAVLWDDELILDNVALSASAISSKACSIFELTTVDCKGHVRTRSGQCSVERGIWTMAF
jgi:hypothetical protein